MTDRDIVQEKRFFSVISSGQRRADEITKKSVVSGKTTRCILPHQATTPTLSPIFIGFGVGLCVALDENALKTPKTDGATELYG